MPANHEAEYMTYVTGRFDQLRCTAHLLCQDWHRADDLLQATLVRLHLSWRRARAADNIDARVHTMLARVFLADRRRGWARNVMLVADPPTIAVADDHDHDHDQRLTVVAALRRVPARQRAVLVLRFDCDMSVEQPAATLRWRFGSDATATVTVDQVRGGLDAELQDDASPPWAGSVSLASGEASIDVHVYPRPGCRCGGKFDTHQNTTINGLPAWLAEDGVTVYDGAVIAEIDVIPVSPPSSPQARRRIIRTTLSSLSLTDLAAGLSAYPERADWRPPLRG